MYLSIYQLPTLALESFSQASPVWRPLMAPGCVAYVGSASHSQCMKILFPSLLKVICWLKMLRYVLNYLDIHIDNSSLLPRTLYVSGTVLSLFHILPHLILTTVLGNTQEDYHSPEFLDAETEALVISGLAQGGLSGWHPAKRGLKDLILGHHCNDLWASLVAWW